MDCSPSGSCLWDSPGKNTRVGCHFLLQGIFLIQGLSLLLLHLLHWHEDSLPLSPLGSPGFTVQALNFVEIHKARMECRSWELSWYSGIWMTPCEKSSPGSVWLCHCRLYVQCQVVVPWCFWFFQVLILFPFSLQCSLTPFLQNSCQLVGSLSSLPGSQPLSPWLFGGMGSEPGSSPGCCVCQAIFSWAQKVS